MMNHTPGPWEVTEHAFGREHETRYYIQHGAATIAAMNGPCLLYGNAASDAALIAAAPEMCAILMQLVEYQSPEDAAVIRRLLSKIGAQEQAR